MIVDLSRAGALDRPDGEGHAGGGTCDDRISFTVAVADGRLAAVRFGADACPAATAAAAWLAGQADGAGLLDAARLGTDEALAACGLPPARRRCVAIAVDALAGAIGDAFLRGALLPASSGRVAVAMSGGVDSAVAMADADPSGAVGVTLRLWVDPAAPDTSRACCTPDAVRLARDACHARGVPHVALDLASAFRSAVVAPFLAAYAAGATPNPCTRCNGAFRLHELVAFADRIGASRVRTGHYARRVEMEGVPLVARGADDTKDQSYMLARVPPAIIERLELPLGDRTKAEVRERARALGLAAADARESQEVCFLGGSGLRPFLRRHGVERNTGPVESAGGAVLGQHDGAAGFTPGQRRGIGVSAGEPLYVLRVDAARNAVVVGPRAALAERTVALDDVAMHVERSAVDAKLRYRMPAIAARVVGVGAQRTLELAEPVLGAARGQTAALYDRGIVVGCGTIR